MAEDEHAAKERIEGLDRMRRESENLIAQSTELLKKIRIRLEELRQLRLAREALLKKRDENKKKKSPNVPTETRVIPR